MRRSCRSATTPATESASAIIGGRSGEGVVPTFTWSNPRAIRRTTMPATPSIANSTVRNGVPLDKLFGTIGAVRERSGARPVSFHRREQLDRGHRHPIHVPRLVRRRRHQTARRTVALCSPIIRRSDTDTAQRRTSTCSSACRVPDAGHRHHGGRPQDRAHEDRVDRRGRHRRSWAARRRPRDTQRLLPDPGHVHSRGDADREALDALVEASCRRSATFDMLVNPTPVVVSTVS